MFNNPLLCLNACVKLKVIWFSLAGSIPGMRAAMLSVMCEGTYMSKLL